MPQPLCEVFGFPVNSLIDPAVYSRAGKLCPYHNVVPECTKDKKANPLGVCSMWDNGLPVILCPIRFTQNYQVIQDTAPFLLAKNKQYSFVSETPLRDAGGNPAGKIDFVLVEHDNDQVIDFGGLEVQAVYITGNIRNPFAYYIQNPNERYNMDWTEDYPGPDWLSSIKRLLRQLTQKGIILNTWGKRLAVACQTQFYDNIWLLKDIPLTTAQEGEMGWFTYKLVINPQTQLFELKLEHTYYMKFKDAIQRFSTLEAGDIQEFIDVIKKKLAGKAIRNQSTHS